jgi:hypothetical protein
MVGQAKPTCAAGSPLEFPCSCIMGQETQAESLCGGGYLLNVEGGQVRPRWDHQAAVPSVYWLYSVVDGWLMADRLSRAGNEPVAVARG